MVGLAHVEGGLGVRPLPFKGFEKMAETRLTSLPAVALGASSSWSEQGAYERVCQPILVFLRGPASLPH